MTRQLLSLLIHIGLLMIPFVCTQQAIDPALLPRLVALFALISLSGILILAKLKSLSSDIPGGLFRQWAVYALWGFAVVSTISLIVAVNRSEAVFEALRNWSFVALFTFLAVAISVSPRLLYQLAKTLTLVSLVIATICLLQYYEISFSDYTAAAGLAHRNLMASAFCLMIPPVLFNALRGRSAWRVTALAALALMTAGILLANARAPWLALILAGLTVLVIVFTSRKVIHLSNQQKRVLSRRLALAVAVMILTAAFFGSDLPRRADTDSFSDRVASVVETNRGSIAERLEVWKHTLSMIGDHPVLGVGPGNWKIYLPYYGGGASQDRTGEVFFQRPHNDFLWILAESGPVALSCWLVFWLSIFYLCLRVIRNSRSRHEIVYGIMMAAGITALLTLSFFSYPKERVVHTFLAALMAAGVLAMHGRVFTTYYQPSKWLPPVALSLLVLVSLAGLAVAAIRLDSELELKKALAARQAGQWQTVVRRIDRARSSWYTLDPTSTPLAWYRGVANHALGLRSRAREDFSEALKAHPYHVHCLNNLATCHEEAGQHDEAIALYRRAVALLPENTEILVNLAAAYFNAGQPSQALATLERVTRPGEDLRYQTYLRRIEASLAND